MSFSFLFWFQKRFCDRKVGWSTLSRSDLTGEGGLEDDRFIIDANLFAVIKCRLDLFCAIRVRFYDGLITRFSNEIRSQCGLVSFDISI